MTDKPEGQAAPNEGAASPRHPVDSDTQPCCGGIGRHTRRCRRLEAIVGHTIRDRLFGDDGLGRDAFAVADDVLAALREVCTIRTALQLDALPDEAIVRDKVGAAFERYGNWRSGLSKWFRMDDEVPADGGDIGLPALLLWHPDWEPAS